MFVNCPQCRYLVATDPHTRAAPAFCPRCGAAMDPGAAIESAPPSTQSTPSIARLLRRDDANVPATSIDPAEAKTLEPIDLDAEAIASRDDVLPDARVIETTDDPHTQLSPPEADATAASPEDASTPLSSTHDDSHGANDAATKPSGAPATETTTQIDNAARDTDDVSAEPAEIVSPATELESDIAPRTDRETIDVPPTAPKAPTSSPAPQLTARAARVPGFMRTHGAPASSRRARWPWIALPLLLITLVLQILIADRARLASDAQWRPMLAALCGVLRCDLPPWHEPQAFAMLDRDVRPLPGAPGVLQARATFRNDARWSQPWPILQLTLKDADGRTLGARALGPADYLGEGSTDTLAPGQSAQIAVHIREPSANVVAFSFDFR